MAILCKDCKWFRRDFPFFWEQRFARCANPKIGAEEIAAQESVMGKPHRYQGYCSIERKYEPPLGCGIDGKLFEPKP